MKLIKRLGKALGMTAEYKPAILPNQKAQGVMTKGLTDIEPASLKYSRDKFVALRVDQLADRPIKRYFDKNMINLFHNGQKVYVLLDVTYDKIWDYDNNFTIKKPQQSKIFRKADVQSIAFTTDLTYGVLFNQTAITMQGPLTSLQSTIHKFEKHYNTNLESTLFSGQNKKGVLLGDASGLALHNNKLCYVSKPKREDIAAFKKHFKKEYDNQFEIKHFNTILFPTFVTIYTKK